MAHTMMYGYSHPERSVEIVNIRVRAIGIVSPIKLSLFDAGEANSPPIIEEYVKVEMNEGAVSIPKFNYAYLLPGTLIEGPALILSTDTTILINPRDNVIVDNYRNLIIDIDVKEENTYVFNSGNVEPLIR